MTIHKVSEKTDSSRRPLAFSYMRVSDPTQAQHGKKGLDRQGDEVFLPFCERHGLIPNPDKIVDKGLSAYHGKHWRKGSLKVFVDAAREGRIPSGSVLVVEDWDRFSRRKSSISHEMLNELFKCDISLGVVREDVIINRHLLDNDLVLRVRLEVSIENAQEKSAGMSHKLRQVWSLRKKDWDEEGKRFLTKANCPYWCDVGEAEFIPNNQAKIIEKIFRLRAYDGKGGSAIAKILNASGILTATGKTWTQARVSRVLADERVLGRKLWNKDFGQDGEQPEISEDYYPRIISQDLFDAARRATDDANDRRGKLGGGEKRLNIFQGLTFCKCGRTLSIQACKNFKKTKITHYILRCVGKRDGTCTEPAGDMRYDEEALLRAFMGEQWDKWFHRGNDDKEVRDLNNKKLLAEQDLAVADQNVLNCQTNFQSFQSEGEQDKELLRELFKNINNAKMVADSLRRDLNAINSELQRLTSVPSGEEMDLMIYKKSLEFINSIKLDRFNYEARRDFNDWLNTLEIKMIVLDPHSQTVQFGRKISMVYRDKSGNIITDERVGQLMQEHGESLQSAVELVRDLPPYNGFNLVLNGKRLRTSRENR